MPAQTWLEFPGGQAAKGVPSEHGNVGSVDHDQNTIDIQGVSTKSMHSAAEGPAHVHTPHSTAVGDKAQHTCTDLDVVQGKVEELILEAPHDRGG